MVRSKGCHGTKSHSLTSTVHTHGSFRALPYEDTLQYTVCFSQPQFNYCSLLLLTYKFESFIRKQEQEMQRSTFRHSRQRDQAGSVQSWLTVVRQPTVNMVVTAEECEYVTWPDPASKSSFCLSWPVFRATHQCNSTSQPLKFLAQATWLNQRHFILISLMMLTNTRAATKGYIHSRITSWLFSD